MDGWMDSDARRRTDGPNDGREVASIDGREDARVGLCVSVCVCVARRVGSCGIRRGCASVD